MSSSRKTRTIAPNHCVGLTPPRINTMIQAHFHLYNLVPLELMAADVASPSEIAPLGIFFSVILPSRSLVSMPGVGVIIIILCNFTKLKYVKVLRGDKS
ncbi:LOW QUALITY PROTEIN: hypothetical protein M8C21_004014, partial [Ambrosia artemisiifolia]